MRRRPSPRSTTTSPCRGAPEDCGGIWGHAELIEILADPAHPEHQDRLEWLGLGPDSADEFDPAGFSVDEINDLLALLAEAQTR